jgi:hypothetical protein
MTKHVSKLRKSAVAALAASVLAAGATTFIPTSAEAQWRPHYGYGYGYKPYRPARGAAVAAGIIGGIAAGALIAGAANPGYAAPAYSYGPAPYYSAPSSYYVAPSYGYAYQPTCYTRRVRQVVDYDTVVIRRVRVCE